MTPLFCGRHVFPEAVGFESGFKAMDGGKDSMPWRVGIQATDHEGRAVIER